MTQLALPKFPASPMFIDIEKQTMSREWLNFLLFLNKRAGGPLTGLRLIATNSDTDFISPSEDTEWVLSKTSGKGLKIDLDDPTFGWRDLLGQPTQQNTGASKPTFATYRNTLKQYQFAATKEEYYEYHIPHDYVLGTDVHLHVHWSHTSTIVTGGTITLGYEVSYAKGHNQAAFPASVSGTITGDASTTQYQHIISETQISASSPSGSQLDTDDLEPDGVIIARLEVTANNITSGGAVPDPFIHYVDVHYRSTNIATKEKDPDFYR